MQLERKEVVLTLIAVLLAVVGFFLDDLLMVAALLVCAACLGVYVAWSHKTRPIWFRASLCVIIALCASGLFARMYIRSQAAELEKELASNVGILKPANDLDPDPRCSSNTPGMLRVILGSNSILSKSDPFDILVVDGEEFLSVEHNGANIRITSLKIFDDRYDSIVRFDNDHLWVRSTTRYERPDESTLIVYDHADARVLRIRFANYNTLVIEGIFRSRNNAFLTVENGRAAFKNTKGGMSFFDGACFVGDFPGGVLPRLLGGSL